MSRVNRPASLGKKLKCLITAPYGADLRPIETLLAKRRMDFVALSDLPVRGATLREKVTEAISKADLFIAILDPKSSNANVYFELGYAQGIGIRTLVVMPPDLKQLPPEIMESLYVRADASNNEAVNFALDQIIASPQARKHRPMRGVRLSHPIGDQADQLIRELDALGDRATEADLQRMLVSAIETSGISLFTHSKKPHTGADLAVWSDELEPIGNPLLIEIKKQVTGRAQINDILGQVLKYLDASNTRWALVLFVKGQFDPSLVTDQGFVSRVMFLKIRDLFDGLRNSSFVDLVRNLRNRYVHGIDT